MKTILQRTAILALGWSGLTTAQSDTKAASTNYELTLSGSTASHGQTTTSANYAQRGYLAEKGARLETADKVIRNLDGLLGTEVTPNGVVLFSDAESVDEGAATALEALFENDDQTYTVIRGKAVQWEIDGPADPVAETHPRASVQTQTVMKDERVTISVKVDGLQTTASLGVQNINSDDFGIYAEDGIDDAWQVNHFGLTNAEGMPNKDPDADGLTNAEEFEQGSDPLVAAVTDPTPTETEADPLETEVGSEPPSLEPLIKGFHQRSDGSYVMIVVASPEASLTLEMSSTLEPGSWIELETVAISSSGEASIEITNDASRQAFYRLR